MAYKKDIKPFLKENNYTWEDMDRIWKEVCEVDWKCKLIADSGKSWDDLTMYQIKCLPTLKEKTLKNLAEKEKKERLEAEKKKKQEEYDKYYSEHFEEILVDKIDKGEPLEISELREMREYSIDRTYGDNRRWQRSVTDVCEMLGRYFALHWEEGLTESQEDDFMDQPYEVFQNKVLKVEQITTYTKKPMSNNNTETKFDNVVDGLYYLDNLLATSKFNDCGIKIQESDDSIVLTLLEKKK